MKLPITHRHNALFKDAQYRKYDDCVTRYGSVIPQASLGATLALLGCGHFSLLLLLGS